MDYDALVIGSGFGGSVAALRLSEKGYRVGVLEMGRRLTDKEIARGNTSARDLFWLPGLGLRGYFRQRFFKHVSISGGIGVGGCGRGATAPARARVRTGPPLEWCFGGF